jgi:hypothetical protein
MESRQTWEQITRFWGEEVRARCFSFDLRQESLNEQALPSNNLLSLDLTSFSVELRKREPSSSGKGSDPGWFNQFSMHSRLDCVNKSAKIPEGDVV